MPPPHSSGITASIFGGGHISSRAMKRLLALGLYPHLHLSGAGWTEVLTGPWFCRELCRRLKAFPSLSWDTPIPTGFPLTKTGKNSNIVGTITVPSPTWSLSIPRLVANVQKAPLQKSIFCHSAISSHPAPPTTRGCYFSKPRSQISLRHIYFCNRLVAKYSAPSLLCLLSERSREHHPWL